MGIKMKKGCMGHFEKLSIELGWNKYDSRWWRKANVSKSTLKRFWMMQPISVSSFESICEAVGVDDWQNFYETEDTDSTRVQSLAQVSDISIPRSELATTKFAITVRGVSFFDENAIILVRECLEDLSNYCVSQFSIEFKPLTSQSEVSMAKWKIRVIGVSILSEDDLEIVEEILNDLQSLSGQKLSVVKIKPVEEMENYPPTATGWTTSSQSSVQTFPESTSEQKINTLSNSAMADNLELPTSG